MNGPPRPAGTPLTVDERIVRGMEALRRGEHSAAEAELQMAIALAPRSSRARFELGRIYLEWCDGPDRDHDGAAESCFARAAELDPDAEAPLVELGRVRLRRRLLPEAETAFRQALLLRPHAPAALDGLKTIDLLKWRRRVLLWGPIAATAVLCLALSVVPWLSRRPNHPATAEQIASLLARSAEARKAAPEALPAKVSPAPKAPPPRRQPATPGPEVASTAKPPVPSPAPPAEAAPSSAPHDAREIARSASSPHREPARARRARHVRHRRPRGPSVAALVKRGEAALRTGRVADALGGFQKAIALQPRYAAAYRGMGSVYVMEGREAEAEAAYRKYLALAPHAPDAGRIHALLSDM